MEIAIAIFIIAVIFIVRAVKIVPQQHAWVVERLGKYAGTLAPGRSSSSRSSIGWRTSTA